MTRIRNMGDSHYFKVDGRGSQKPEVQNKKTDDAERQCREVKR